MTGPDPPSTPDDDADRGHDARAAPFDAGISPDDPDRPLSGLQAEEALVSEDATIRSGRLAGKSMWAAIAVLAIPVLLQQTLTAFVGLVDKMLSGSLPAEMVVPA